MTECEICNATIERAGEEWIDSTGFEDASHPYPHEHEAGER